MQITPLLIAHNGLRCGSAQFKQKINLGCDQAPASGESRTESAVNENIVVQIPDRCLPRPGVVKDVVRVAIPVKVGRRHNAQPWEDSDQERCRSRLVRINTRWLFDDYRG